MNAIARLVPLAAALYAIGSPLTANADITTYSAASPKALPQPAVLRVPTTFGAPIQAAPRQSALDQYLASDRIRAARAAQQAAYEKRFGTGTPVKLRARRY